MTKRVIEIQTDMGDLFKIPMDDITNYSVSPEEITYTLKDGTFIKFFKHSLTYIQETYEYRISKGEAEILENKLKVDNTLKVKGDIGCWWK